jgi:hypothetical protein
MRPHLSTCVTVLLALFLSACATRSEPQAPDMTITYFTWGGWSPGAGYGGTDLFACQYDLRENRMRVIDLSKGQSTIENGLPAQRDKIIALLAAELWRPLAAERARALQAAADAWRSPKPPVVYAVQRGLGTENGYAEELCVRAGDQECRTEIDARAMRSKVPPSPEWYALVGMVREYTDLPQGHPGQIMQIRRPEGAATNR